MHASHHHCHSSEIAPANSAPMNASCTVIWYTHVAVAGNGDVNILQWSVGVAEGNHRNVHVWGLRHRLQEEHTLWLSVHASPSLTMPLTHTFTCIQAGTSSHSDLPGGQSVDPPQLRDEAPWKPSGSGWWRYQGWTCQPPQWHRYGWQTWGWHAAGCTMNKGTHSTVTPHPHLTHNHTNTRDAFLGVGGHRWLFG